MPIGVTEDDKFLKELERFVGKERQFEKPEFNQTGASRKKGSIEVPSAIRKVVQEESLVGTKSKELQKIFGVSQSSVSAYKTGQTSLNPSSGKDSELVEHKAQAIEKIETQARSKILSALGLLTDEKIDAGDARDISGVAKDLSGVIKNLQPDAGTTSQPMQVLIYSPRKSKEEDFDVIDLSEVDQ